ncbi:MAG: outer membrane beta-barrel family protein, partial [Chitinophagaceae bacterium]
RKLDERRTFNVSYTKRLTRPYILDLNPNVNTSDPKNIKSGNPELKPEIVHQAEFSYNFNTGQDFFMNTSVFWKQTNNTIIEFMETNAQGISFTSKQNLAANKQFGLNFSATSNLSERLAVNGNANIHYYNYNSKAFNISRAGCGADVNVNGTYKLPHSISVQAFAKYNTRMITLLGTLDDIYQYSFAGKKEIKQARISVTLAAVNIFTNYISQANTKQRFNYISIVDQHFYNRSLKLTVNWEFGGVWRQKERKKIDNNDVNVQGKG